MRERGKREKYRKINRERQKAEKKEEKKRERQALLRQTGQITGRSISLLTKQRGQDSHLTD